MIRRRRNSRGVEALLLSLALVAVPALVRATQTLGRGVDVKQISGFSTSLIGTSGSVPVESPFTCATAASALGIPDPVATAPHGRAAERPSDVGSASGGYRGPPISRSL